MIVAEGHPADLKAAVADRHVIEIETFGVADGAGRTAAGVPTASHSVVGRGSRAGAGAARAVGPGTELTQALLGLLDGTAIGRVIAREPTLEDAYVELVGAA